VEEQAGVADAAGGAGAASAAEQADVAGGADAAPALAARMDSACLAVAWVECLLGDCSVVCA